MKKLTIVGLVSLSLLITGCNDANAMDYGCGEIRVNETSMWYDEGSFSACETSIQWESHTTWSYIKTLILYIFKPEAASAADKTRISEDFEKPATMPENTPKVHEEAVDSIDKSKFSSKITPEPRMLEVPIQKALNNTAESDENCIADGIRYETMFVNSDPAIQSENGSASRTVDTNDDDYGSEESEGCVNCSGFNVTNNNGSIGIYPDYADHSEIAENTNNTPTLRDCNMNTKPNYWRPENPTSYIIPDNRWVKYYASQLYVSPDGKIRYKDQKVAASVDTDGTVLAWKDKLFKGEYVPDSVQFKDKSFQPPDKIDYYTNPDYYLFNSRKGDCEDYATAVCSMLLSGEVSIQNADNLFVKQFVPAKVVMGWCGGERHTWVEYMAYDTVFACDCGVNAHTGKSVTKYTTKDEMYNYWDFKPVYEYNDVIFREYVG